MASATALAFRSLQPMIVFKGSCLTTEFSKNRVGHFLRALAINEGIYFIILMNVGIPVMVVSLFWLQGSLNTNV